MLHRSSIINKIAKSQHSFVDSRRRDDTYGLRSLACIQSQSRTTGDLEYISLSLSLGAVSNSDVGGHGFPLFPVSCSFDDLDFTDFQQLAEAFHEVQPWSSSASLALNFPSDHDVLKSMHAFSRYVPGNSFAPL